MNVTNNGERIIAKASLWETELITEALLYYAQNLTGAERNAMRALADDLTNAKVLPYKD